MNAPAAPDAAASPVLPGSVARPERAALAHNGRVATGVTLVLGGRASAREAAIAAAMPEQGGAAILEGLADAGGALADRSHATVVRIAPGCLCCSGNMILRVTLNRLLHHPPALLFISLADASHLATLRRWLESAPYDRLLWLGPDLDLDAAT